MAASQKLFLALIFGIHFPSHGVVLPEPRLEWQYLAKSNLYAPPLVADIHPALGVEIVISDSEARKLVCLSATGERVWEYDGGWMKRLTSGAALSFKANDDGPALLIGNPDGNLHCIEARTGRKLWSTLVGDISWTNAIWTDVDGDGRDEAVAATRNEGIVCLRADGSILWKHPDENGVKPPRISSTIAAADVDGDGASEIFFCSLKGPASLNGEGSLRWETAPGDYFLGSIVLGDADQKGSGEVYACSIDESALQAFDASTGRRLWTAQLSENEHSTSGPALALGDLDFDGHEEILVGDENGAITCFDYRGEFQWVHQVRNQSRSALSLGDVDGDGEIEVIVASSDRNLSCLNSMGRLEWTWRTDRRLISAATLADVDGDGRTEIVFGGCDRVLRVLTLDGRYDEDLIPWPSARQDPAQSGSSLGPKRNRAPRLVKNRESLFQFGNFERSRRIAHTMDYPADKEAQDAKIKTPEGWRVLEGSNRSWSLDSEVAHQGRTSLQIQSGTSPFIFVTSLIDRPRHLESIDAEISYRGPGSPGATLCWWGDMGIVREDELEVSGAPSGEATGTWVRLVGKKRVPPREADRFQLVCSHPASESDEPGWWDGATIIGNLREPATVQVLVNQVGYDIGAPKHFTVQANFLTDEATFELLTVAGESVQSGQLSGAERITGAYGNDWGSYYYQGDFTPFDQPGRYRIQIALDDEESLSWLFEIGENLIWERTARPAYEFFYYQRCGMEIPGFHEACHLDDSVDPQTGKQFDLPGGWHDAGDYNKYHNAPYVYGLAVAYENLKEAYDSHDADSNGRSDFLDEILWGGDFSRRMMAPDGSARGRITSGYGFWGGAEQETDNLPNTGDERLLDGGESGVDSSNHTAAMAKIALLREEDAGYLEAAVRGFEWAQKNGLKGPLQLSAALDLYAVTGREEYADIAKVIFLSVRFSDPFLVEKYDQTFDTDHSQQVRETLFSEAEEKLRHADNPFGVFTYGDSGNPNFFNTPADENVWHLGTTDHLLVAADRVALADRYHPDPSFRKFVYDQINWILGNNPFDTSLMEGSGSRFVPTYHQRLLYGGVERGAIPGGIINGVTWRAPGDDRPRLDLSGVDIPAFESNEVWLPHNTYYLKLLSNLQRLNEVEAED